MDRSAERKYGLKGMKSGKDTPTAERSQAEVEKTGRVEWNRWLCKDHIDPFFKNDITIILNEKGMVDSAGLRFKPFQF